MLPSRLWLTGSQTNTAGQTVPCKSVTSLLYILDSFTNKDQHTEYSNIYQKFLFHKCDYKHTKTFYEKD